MSMIFNCYTNIKTFKSASYLVKRFILYSAVVMFPINVMAIVNMDGLHFKNKAKDTFKADLELSMSGSSGNSSATKAALNSQLSWIDDRSINLALLGYQYGESNHIRSVNKAFIHYRYIYQLTTRLDVEIFGQIESNEFTRLSYRGLLGTGARFSISNSEQHNAYFGMGAFYSKEKIEFTNTLTDGGEEEFVRANFYLLSKYRVNPMVSFSNIIYYQPRISRASDYRALLESKFDFKINKDLSFRISLELEHDSEPSQTIEKTDFSYMTGLIFSF